MPEHTVLLTIPGLTADDLASIPTLRARLADGDRAALAPTFPCLAGPVRANMATGVTCGQHGVVADCFYHAARRELFVGPEWREMIMAPTLWQVLNEHQPDAKSAICFDSDAQDCESTARECPDFLWCDFSQIAVAAERAGPDSQEVKKAQSDLDAALGRLFSIVDEGGESPPLWIVVSPYTVASVNHVLYPNRALHESALLRVRVDSAGEHADLHASRAWAMTDRQVSHIYVAEHDPATVADAARLFTGRPGVAEVLAGDERAKYDLVHERSGDVIVISTQHSWQSSAWTGEATAAAERIRGSYGAPALDESQRGVIFTSQRGVLAGRVLLDTDVCDLVLRQFGI